MTAGIGVVRCSRIKAGDILCRDLVGWWEMNENDGLNIWDHSGNRKHATMQNMTPAAWTADSRGFGLACDADDDEAPFVSNEQTATSVYAEGTFTGLGVTNYATIFSTPNFNFAVGSFLATFRLFVGVVHSVAGGMYYTQEGIVLGQRYGFALTHSGVATADPIFYLNGIRCTTLVAMAANGVLNSRVGTGYLLNTWLHTEAWGGTMSRIGYWKRALSDADIRRLHVNANCIFSERKG